MPEPAGAVVHSSHPSNTGAARQIQPRGTGSVERAFVWCGIAGLVLIGIGLGVAHLLPPPSPSRTADQVAAFYQHHTNSFRVGTVIMGFGATMLAPWLAAVARRLYGIPVHGPTTTYCFIGLGMMWVFQIVLPIGLGQVVAFRPDRPATDTEALNDLFFILFISPAYVFVVQMALTGYAILADRRECPAFPHWLGYVSLWAALGTVAGVVTIFFKDGPWAWNGAFGWWIPVVTFGIWIAAMSYATLRPLVEIAHEPKTATSGPAG